MIYTYTYFVFGRVNIFCYTLHITFCIYVLHIIIKINILYIYAMIKIILTISVQNIFRKI